MKNEIKITINIGRDGFYGSEGEDAVNATATEQEYEQTVTDAIAEVYPGATIEFAWTDCSDGRGCSVDAHNADEIKETVDDIEAEVYNDGEFWVE